MTRTERSQFEKNMFINVNNDKYLKDIIKKLLFDYKAIPKKYSDVNYVCFVIKYLKLVLNNKNHKVPNSKYLISKTSNSKSAYYRYREQLFDEIKSALENEQCI